MRSPLSPSPCRSFRYAALPCLCLTVAALACDASDAPSNPPDASGTAPVDATAPPDAPPPTDASDPAQELLQCLVDHCSTELGNCVGDTECSGWLRCNQECDPDDPILCPTTCGWYYQSPFVAPFASCMFDNACVEQDYSSATPCDSPTVAASDLSGLGGTWWLTRHRSEEYALTSDCQKLELEEVSPTLINVVSTAPLTLNDEERICQLVGTYQLQSDGSIRAEYSTSYANYFEKWALVHKSQNAFLVDICFAAPGTTMRRYGTWLFSRIPVETIEPSELATLNAHANAAFGRDIGDMQTVSMTGCPNE